MTGPGGQPISLREAAYRHLRAAILSCHLPPGRLMTEKRLATETGFGISRVRDALTRLGQDGLIRTLPRKGYQVTPLTPKSIGDLFVLWLIVGPQVVRLGMSRAGEGALTRVRAGLETLGESGRDHPGPDTALGLIAMAGETFRILALAADNDYLTRIVDRVSGDVARVWTLILEADASAAAFVTPQNRIKDILDARNADAAAEATRRYIAESHERVRRAVTRWPSIVSADAVT